MIPDIARFKVFLRHLNAALHGANIFDSAAQVAFYCAFSLFPLLFTLFTLLGITLDTSGGLREEMFSYFERIMPVAASRLIHQTVLEVIEGSSTGKLLLGAALTFFSATSGLDSLRSTLNAIYGLRESRNWVRCKVQSYLLTVVFMILLVAILIGFFYGWQFVSIVLGNLAFETNSAVILVSLQWLMILLVMLFACELIYNLLPNLGETSWKWLTPGSVVAIVFWLISTSGFKLYISFFDNYSKIYGSLGAVIILMLWLYLTALGVIVGGVVNAVEHRVRLFDRDEKNLEPETINEG